MFKAPAAPALHHYRAAFDGMRNASAHIKGIVLVFFLMTGHDVTCLFFLVHLFKGTLKCTFSIVWLCTNEASKENVM